MFKRMVFVLLCATSWALFGMKNQSDPHVFVINNSDYDLQMHIFIDVDDLEPIVKQGTSRDLGLLSLCNDGKFYATDIVLSSKDTRPGTYYFDEQLKKALAAGNPKSENLCFYVTMARHQLISVTYKFGQPELPKSENGFIPHLYITNLSNYALNFIRKDSSSILLPARDFVDFGKFNEPNQQEFSGIKFTASAGGQEMVIPGEAFSNTLRSNGRQIVRPENKEKHLLITVRNIFQIHPPAIHTKTPEWLTPAEIEERRAERTEVQFGGSRAAFKDEFSPAQLDYVEGVIGRDNIVKRLWLAAAKTDAEKKNLNQGRQVVASVLQTMQKKPASVNPQTKLVATSTPEPTGESKNVQTATSKSSVQSVSLDPLWPPDYNPFDQALPKQVGEELGGYEEQDVPQGEVDDLTQARIIASKGKKDTPFDVNLLTGINPKLSVPSTVTNVKNASNVEKGELPPTNNYVDWSALWRSIKSFFSSFGDAIAAFGSGMVHKIRSIFNSST
jgi:hypothetical protein